MVAHTRRGLAYKSALFILLLLTVNSAYEPKSLWKFFTSWNLSLQYLAYISVLDDPTKRVVFLDVAALSAWMVAISYSVVIGISGETLHTMHELYGVVPFWAGNGLLHYIPPFLLFVLLHIL